MPDSAQPEEIFDTASAGFDAATKLPDYSILDKPIWNALSTRHLDLAQGDGRARRYPPEIGPLSGIPEQTEENYAALGELTRSGGAAALFSLEELRIPASLTVLRSGALYQMVRRSPVTNEGAPSLTAAVSQLRVGSHEPTLRPLTSEDAPAMVELAELTEPGPFRLRTMELGNFYGIFHGTRLAAMAGKRMHWPGFTEVSGVCTHPEARGRGYARILMSIVIGEIEQAGETAMLHVFTTNPAIRLYETLELIA
jgi:GNAT superfamily N-acetyltransferase